MENIKSLSTETTTLEIPYKETGAEVIPEYLEKKYWWAYVRPWALNFWDHPSRINMVLLGNYKRLCNNVLKHVPAGKNVVQLGSCYGDLIARLGERSNKLTVVDCVPGQLELARNKHDCHTVLADARDSGIESESADIVILFFLLHELPDDWKQGVLSEAYRIAGKTGKVILADFGIPHRWNLFGYFERLVFKMFEPYAKESTSWDWEPGAEEKLFGGLYRLIASNLEAAMKAKGPVLKSARMALSRIS